MTEQHDSDVKHQTNKTATNHFGESASVWKGVYGLEIMMYSRTLVARTRLSRTPGIARTRSSVPAISLYI